MSEMEGMMEWVDFYAHQMSWALFPVHSVNDGVCTCARGEHCKQPGKHPANDDGFKSASRDEFALSVMFEGKDRNIGLATGRKSGVFVVDIDGPEGEASLKDLQRKHGELPETLQSSTGRGRHLFFKMPPEGSVACSASKVGKAIDVRGDGGYVILPPSKHYSRATYLWTGRGKVQTPIAEAPAWLIEAVLKQKREPTPQVEEFQKNSSASPTTLRLVASALEVLPPDMAYNDWVAVGMALKDMGCPLEMWEEWSAKGEKWEAGVTAEKWLSFKSAGVGEGTLYRLADEHGWENPINKRVQIRDETPSIDALKPEEEPSSEPVFKLDPTKFPTIISETANWILQCSYRPQPELAVMATIAAVSAVVGRKYEMQDLRTTPNLFICGLSPTGHGKDAARSSLRELFTQAQLGDFMGPGEIKSAQGLMRVLNDKPSHLALWDELGFVFESMGGKSPAAYKVELKSRIMQANTSTQGVLEDGQYADTKKNIDPIHNNNLVIYGTSTPETLEGALTPAMAQSGELNRWILVKPSQKKPKYVTRVKRTPPSEQLRAMWIEMSSVQCPKDHPDDMHSVKDPQLPPKRIPIQWDEGAMEMWEDYIERIDMKSEGKRSEPLYSRAAEMVVRLGMVFAIADKPAEPSMSTKHLALAIDIIDQSVAYMVFMMSSAVFEDTPRAHAERKIEAAIKAAGGKGILWQGIASAARGLSNIHRKEAMDTMMEAGVVLVISDRGQGNIYVHRDNVEAAKKHYVG